MKEPPFGWSGLFWLVVMVVVLMVAPWLVGMGDGVHP